MDPSGIMQDSPFLGALGIAGNILGGREKQKQQRRAMRDLLAGIDASRGIAGETYEDLTGMYAPLAGYSTEALDQMMAMYPELMAAETLPEMGEFEFDKTISDYLDPSMDFRMQQGQRAMDASAAAAGGLLSGKALLEAQDYGQNLASTEYGAADARMSRDKNFAYQDFLNRFRAQGAAVQDRYSRLQDQYDRLSGVQQIGMGALNNQAGARQNYGNQLMGLAMDEANTRATGQGIGGWADLIYGQTGNIGNVIGGATGQLVGAAAGVPVGGYPVGQNNATGLQPQGDANPFQEKREGMQQPWTSNIE